MAEDALELVLVVWGVNGEGVGWYAGGASVTELLEQFCLDSDN